MARVEQDASVPEAIPAATVLLLRDHAPKGLEVLMVRRNATLSFAGGMWVFPGGRVDPGDWAGGDNTAGLAAAGRAAVREVAEEAGLEIATGDLVPFSHWTPPPEAPKRFATWFFLAAAPSGVVTVDGGEIHAHQWIGPMEALRRFKVDEIELIPPTWITLAQLSAYEDVASVLDEARRHEPRRFVTRFAMSAQGAVSMYDGDAGYADGDADRPGRRHRLLMARSGWSYSTPDGVVVAP